jgi:hypothetical protein
MRTLGGILLILLFTVLVVDITLKVTTGEIPIFIVWLGVAIGAAFVATAAISNRIDRR